jgi:biopolymer transport protein ExbD
MKYLLEVCLVTFSLTANMICSAAAQSAPAMQKGISVQLPASSNAVAIPKADSRDALVVTVTSDGSVYFGDAQISPQELAARVKSELFGRSAETLYVKADARAPYAAFIKVVDSVRTAGVNGLTLLTVQRGDDKPGALVPPKGLELLLRSSYQTK